jgi:iron complex transport system ATP-binding protein
MSPPLTPTLRLEGLRGAHAPRAPISLEAEGGLLGVVGPNGVGKSTLLRLILGAERPTQGRALLNGAPLRALPAATRAAWVCYLPQDPPCSPHWTVEELVGQGARGEGRATQEALSALDLTPLAARALSEVSGGERRRAFLARVMAQRAALSLLDEPLAHLDWAQGEAQLRLLKRHTRALGGLTLITLHDLNLAALYCDRLLLLTPSGGAWLGPPAEVLTEERLHAAFGALPLLTPHPRGGGAGEGEREVAQVLPWGEGAGPLSDERKTGAL